MPCEPSVSLLNNLSGWSMSAGLSVSYSSSVELTNEESQYDADALRLTPLEIAVRSGASVSGFSGAATLLSGVVTWVRGLVSDVSPVEAVGSKIVTLKLKSFPARLAAKAVNTEVYDSESAATVLADLATVFGTLPGALYDFSEVVRGYVSGCVSGNNLIDEMRLVAQAGYTTLYVSETGLLRAGAWKDADSVVDHVIPAELVAEAKQDRTSSPVPSRVRVRGCFRTQLADGERDLGDSQKPPGDASRPNRGPVTYRISNGVPCPEAILGVRGVSADETDIANAQVVTTLTLVRRENAGDGGLDLAVTQTQPLSGDMWLPWGDHTCDVRIFGKRHPDLEWVSAMVRNQIGPKTQEETARKIIAMMDYVGGSAPCRRSAGGMSPAGPANTSSNRTADETEETQIEMVVTDPDLMTEFGVVDEQIVNLYLASPEQLFDVAVRRFQEIKMSRQSWTVDVPYLPAIALNDVVTFTTPETSAGGGQTVTGLVTKMSVSWSFDGGVKMQITVESFVEVGGTTYVSENLLRNGDLRAVDDVYWTTNGSLESNFWVEEGVIWMCSVDGLYLRQVLTVESGVTCSVSVAGELLLGVPLGSLSLTVTDAVTLAVLGSAVVSGATSFDFTSTANPIEVKLIVSGGGTGKWRLEDLKLVKTVVR